MDSDFNVFELLPNLTSKIIESWKLTKARCKVLVKTFREKGEDIRELMKAQTSETHLGKKVEMEILLRKAVEDKSKWMEEILKGIAFTKNQEVEDLKQEAENLIEEVRNKEEAIKNLEIKNTGLVKVKSCLTLRVAQTQERMRKISQAEKSELEKAHRLECHRLRSEVQQTEAKLAKQLSEARQTLDEFRKQSRKEARMQKYQAENTLLAKRVRELTLELQYIKLKEIKKRQVESAPVTECGLTEASTEQVKLETNIKLMGRLDMLGALEQHFMSIFKRIKKNGLALDVQELEDGNVRKKIRVE